MSIKFYSTSGPYGSFSNFSKHSVELKGLVWSTSEHYFQAQKFIGTEHEELVRKASGPGDAAGMGRDRSRPLRKDWELVKDDIMREVVLAKFTQHESIGRILVATLDQELIEHTTKDRYWADGGDGSGKNMLGKILMEVREILKSKGIK